MKTEYFMQVKTYEEDEQSGLLEKIKEALGEMAEYYQEPGMLAFSACGGLSLEYLHLSPHRFKDKDSERHATWYTFRITDVVYELPDVSFKELPKTIETLLDAKIGDVKTGTFYRVTATDVPMDFKIIRKTSETVWRM